MLNDRISGIEFWTPFVSATAPVMFSRFVVEDLESIEVIARAVRRSPLVKSLSPLVFYFNNLFEWPGVTEIERLLLMYPEPLFNP
ncbi:MAG: hypothetical protein ACW99X_15560 [Candidatus Thorarchaeota archaeon]